MKTVLAIKAVLAVALIASFAPVCAADASSGVQKPHHRSGHSARKAPGDLGAMKMVGGDAMIGSAKTASLGLPKVGAGVSKPLAPKGLSGNSGLGQTTLLPGIGSASRPSHAHKSAF